MRVLAVMFAAFVLAPTLPGAAGQASLASGLRGVVKRGPTMPVCIVGKTCEEPAVGVVLVFKRAGVVKARVTTRRAGAYTVWLRPGVYTVVVSPPRRIGTGLTPRIVRVPSGRLARVNFLLDTGIR